MKADQTPSPSDFDHPAKAIEKADQNSSPSNPPTQPEDKKKKFKVRFDEAYQKSHEEKSQMEKEFFENALKQKRYQNNITGTAKTSPPTDEPKGQSSSPGANVSDVAASKGVENQTSNQVEFF
jgi:hypothetical protein